MNLLEKTRKIRRQRTLWFKRAKLQLVGFKEYKRNPKKDKSARRRQSDMPHWIMVAPVKKYWPNEYSWCYMSETKLAKKSSKF